MENNEKLDNCLCNAARYLIIFLSSSLARSLFGSMTVAMRSIRKQNIAILWVAILRNRQYDDRLFDVSLSASLIPTVVRL